MMTLEQHYANSIEFSYIPVVKVYTELKIMNYRVVDVNVVPVPCNVYESSLAADDRSLCTDNP